jgi:hypothetical protein
MVASFRSTGKLIAGRSNAACHASFIFKDNNQFFHKKPFLFCMAGLYGEHEHGIGAKTTFLDKSRCNAILTVRKKGEGPRRGSRDRLPAFGKDDEGVPGG